MKALILEDYKKFSYREYPTPNITAPDDVLVRVKAAAICGSDVHGMDGSTGRRRPPLIMGHEAAGEIAAVGAGVTAFSVGDRVTFNSTIYCGTCEYCSRGEVNLCDNRQVLGVSCAEYHRDGAFAEFIVVPQRILYTLPDQLDYIDAAMAEPAAVAAHAAAITPLQPDDRIAVVGAGLIGLLLLQILKTRSAAELIAFDTDADRRAAALQCGAAAAFDPTLAAENTAYKAGFARVFEAVGTAAPIRTAIDLVRKGGSVTLIGNLSPTVEIPLQSLVTRQIALLGSCAMAGEYPLVLDLMAHKKINVRPLISAVAPLSEGALWFSRLYAKEKGLLKILLVP